MTVLTVAVGINELLTMPMPMFNQGIYGQSIVASISPNSSLIQTAETLAQSQSVMWVMVAAFLVFFMQAGFALVESGSVRAKNTVNVMMKNYTDMCFGAVIFYLVGYGLMMGDNPTGWLGMSHFAPWQMSHQEWAVLFFQTMFAATAITIASGAMAERVKFSGYLLAAVGSFAVIYPIFAGWAWGGLHGGQGWLARLGFVDFAGSTVVHSVGGWLALAGILVIGPRLGRFAPSGLARVIEGHNLTLVALGGFVLWVGWFGFNTGSTLSGAANLGLIGINTHLAAAAAVMTYLGVSYVSKKAILLTDTVNASLTGLVAITAGCATMIPLFAIVTGAVAALVYLLGKKILDKLRIDDVVYAVSVHAFGGVWGTLAAGLFFSGDVFNLHRMMIQMLGIGVGFVWAFGLGLLLFVLIEKTVGLKASKQHQLRGLDYSEHAELGYPEFQGALFDPDTMQKRH